MRILLAISFCFILQLASAQQLIPYQVYKSGEQNTSPLWGYKNEKHQVVISPINQLPAFYKGDFVLLKKEKAYGIMDKMGKIVVPISYYNIFPGKAYWTLTSEAGKYFFSTRTREIITVKDAEATTYNKLFIKKITEVKAGSISTNSLSSYQLINDKGEALSDQYYYIHDFGDGAIHFTTEEHKQGLMDSAGKIILPATYSSIGVFKNGQAVVKEKGKDGLIDLKGNEIAPLNHQLFDLQNTMYEVKDSAGVYITDFKSTSIGKNMGMTYVVKGTKDFGVFRKGKEGVFLLNKDNAIQNKVGYEAIVSTDGKNYLLLENYKLFKVINGKRKQLPYDSVRGIMNANKDNIYVYGNVKGNKYSVLLDNNYKEVFKTKSEMMEIDMDSDLANTYFLIKSAQPKSTRRNRPDTKYKLSYIDAHGKLYSDVLK